MYILCTWVGLLVLLHSQTLLYMYYNHDRECLGAIRPNTYRESMGVTLANWTENTCIHVHVLYKWFTSKLVL